MTEELVIISDCKPVKDRLMQDPAIQYQNEYFMERAKEFGFDPSETSVLGTNATSTTSPSDQVIMNIPVGSSSSNGGQGYQPNRVVVYPGGTVIWSNQDNACIPFSDIWKPWFSPDGVFDRGIIISSNQQSGPITMPTQQGDYRYFCTVHPFLVGTVTVQ